MKNTIFFLPIILLFFVGCEEHQNEEFSDIDKEIEGLKTIEDKKAFFKEIFEDDQKLRGGKISQIALKYGENSKEHREIVAAQINQDEINLIKIEKYLKIYGHPKRSEVGNAADTPWVVIHHSNGGYKVREKHFESLYGAYLKDDIDDGSMSLYLRRMYSIKYDTRFKIESPYKPEDEINQLIKELNLEKKKLNVLQHIEK